jgi:ferric-dicitrate binding protein FerR (iron transport regulator)
MFMRTTPFSVLIALSTAATVYAQQPAGQIRSVGGVVEVQDPAGSGMATPGQSLAAPETIRTGSGSFADLAPAVGTRILVEAQSQIEVRALGVSPLIWLESGRVTVASQDADLQIQTRSGLFSPAEWPFEAEITNSSGSVNVVVIEGRIRTRNLDAQAVTFGAPGNKTYRSYTAGIFRPQAETASPPPNLFVQECLQPRNSAAPGRPQPH